jgi:excisionase family DNA binding protein
MTLVTSQELATHLACSLEKVYRMTRAHEIPYIQVGREYRYDTKAVLAKLAEPPRLWQQSNRSRGRKRAT